MKFIGILLRLVFAMAAASLWPAGVFAQQSDVEEHTLKNGLKILVQRDGAIPNVALYLFYRIGSRNEKPGTTGISHFFEHMMFNGARKYGPGEFDRIMEGAGGSNNAYTSRDVTVYQDWFPPSALEAILDLEADRIQNLSFDPKMIESERGVVASERRTSVDADNFGALSEQLWAAAYTAHPYQWPIVGWMVDIENWSMDDLWKHFQAGYSPANATLVVVGDVAAAEFVRLARKHLEPIPSRALPEPVRTREPQQTGERRVTVRKYAQLPILMIGYHVPESAHADYYAIQVLATILFSGQSSRLYQRLVDNDQLALSIDGGTEISLDPTLFTLTAQPREGVHPEQVEKAVYDEIGKLQRDRVSEHELEKAKNILVADFYREIETISGRANALGTYGLFIGDYRRLFSAARDFGRVTRDDILRVASQYLNENNRTVATLLPESESPAPKP